MQNDPALLSADARREATGENPRQALANLLPDLRGSAGLYRLREELLVRVNKAAAPAKVSDVLFKEMLVQ